PWPMRCCPTECFTGLCVVCIVNQPVHIIRTSADSIIAGLCQQTGPSSNQTANTLFACSANALLSNVMLHWPMCCMRSPSAGTHYTNLGQFDNCRVMSTNRSVKQSNSQHAICMLGQCTVFQCNALLAYVLYAYWI